MKRRKANVKCSRWRGEGRRIRETEEETGRVEEIYQGKKKGKEHQTEDDVIQEVLRENSHQPQEPSPCCVYHILEGVRTKKPCMGIMKL